MALYIGLLSGTSMDGVDVCLADLGNPNPLLIGTHHRPYPHREAHPGRYAPTGTHGYPITDASACRRGLA